MSELFPDRLLDAIAKKGSPICVGIDPVFEMLPDEIAGDARTRNANDSRGGPGFDLRRFTTALLQVVAPHVPCVKFQSAYFEKYYHEGVQAYYELVHEAHENGLIVIGDVKRGDIGSTSTAYAQAHLAHPHFDELEEFTTPDAITVNPFLGLDTLEPYIKTAADFDKGIFVLVRTSNPGSADLQDVKTDDGRTFSEMLADKLAKLAAAKNLVGSSGYSAIGAVVGATQPHTMQSLRERLPQSIFLLPGLLRRAAAASAEMTRAAFKDGKGAIVSASRSILYAHRDPKYASLVGEGWERCVEQAVLDMKADLAKVF